MICSAPEDDPLSPALGALVTPSYQNLDPVKLKRGRGVGVKNPPSQPDCTSRRQQQQQPTQ